jgi:hypothetical protein
MKIHPHVQDKDNAKKLARATGLNKIKAKVMYTLQKTGSKNASPHGYGDTMDCGRGNVTIVAQDNYVWILLSSPSDWFKTSPVLSCTKIDDGFKIETENSFYELRG